jgi:hypothetical protein
MMDVRKVESKTLLWAAIQLLMRAKAVGVEVLEKDDRDRLGDIEYQLVQLERKLSK